MIHISVLSLESDRLNFENKDGDTVWEPMDKTLSWSNILTLQSLT